MANLLRGVFGQPVAVFALAIALRVGLLVYGHYQDQWSAIKYTDIDYFVFTDAAQYVSRGRSPYLRDTYRYTPLLAWILVPTSWGGLWFDFGKVVFAASDVLAGWLIYRTLTSSRKMQSDRALHFASIWLLNPMVAQISTRGSSEGLLIVIVIGLLWAMLQKRLLLCGCLLGLAVHFKIYPFIYGPTILWWLGKGSKESLSKLLSPERRTIVFWSASTFLALNMAMFFLYGSEFVEHTFLYHWIRSDHRHNFSPYNILLYMNSSPVAASNWRPEAFAFIPQLGLAVFAIPLALAKLDPSSCMLAQTMTFVTFNKVCTSQYFLWYLAFLPFYLPDSRLVESSRTGALALSLWIAGQAAWLASGYRLEFLGLSTFAPSLWLASLSFFVINVGILGIIVTDVRRRAPSKFAPATLKVD